MEISSADRAQWFTEARFGMFIHWGIYSAAEGEWRGEVLRNPLPNFYAEWLQNCNRIPTSQWVELIRRLKIDEETVEEWVVAAKRAGMRYVTLTSKHHDGLALWPSAVSSFNYPHLSGTGFDVLAAFRDACRKHGLKLGIYYSHWHDWEHPHGYGNFWERPEPTREEFSLYWEQKCIPQVAELIEDYQPDLLWFDSWLPIEEMIFTREQALALIAMVRRRAPQCLINSRLGIKEIGDGGVDFETMGDNQFPAKPIPHPWQTDATLNYSWGYHKWDHAWKSVTQLIHHLATNASLGGNMTLNIGPKADGSLSCETVDRLERIGDWLALSGESVYGAAASPFPIGSHDWGCITSRRAMSDVLEVPERSGGYGRSFLYLHVFRWPVDGVIRVSGLRNRVLSASLLAGKRGELEIVQRGLSLHLKGPAREPGTYDHVVVLEIEGEPAVEPLMVGEASCGGYSFKPQQATIAGGIELHDGDKGCIPPYAFRWQGQPGASLASLPFLSWTFYVAEPCEFAVEISYACQKASEGELFFIECEGEKLFGAVTAPPCGQGEHEFRQHRLGTISLKRAGIHQLKLGAAIPLEEELMRFAWLHLY